MTLIIGLTGPAGSGKSSAAEYLERYYGALRFSLASPLKRLVKSAFDFTDEQVYGTQEQKEAVDPRYGFSPRWFLQRVGTNGCREVFGENFWVDRLFEAIEYARPDIAVVEDVRFANEANALRLDDNVVWRLNPPEDDITMSRAMSAGQHQSETEWKRFAVNAEFHPRYRGLDYLHRFIDEQMQHLIWKRRADALPYLLGFAKNCFTCRGSGKVAFHVMPEAVPEAIEDDAQTLPYRSPPCEWCSSIETEPFEVNGIMRRHCWPCGRVSLKEAL